MRSKRVRKKSVKAREAEQFDVDEAIRLSERRKKRKKEEGESPQQRVTLSGVSSGAAFANQLAVAFSSRVSGVAAFAGGRAGSGI